MKDTYIRNQSFFFVPTVQWSLCLSPFGFFLSFYLFRPWTCIVKTDATYSSISFAIVLLRILHYHRHPVVISHQFLHLTIRLCIVQKQRNTGERKWPCIFPATIESKFNKCLLFHLFHLFFPDDLT